MMKDFKSIFIFKVKIITFVIINFLFSNFAYSQNKTTNPEKPLLKKDAINLSIFKKGFVNNDKEFDSAQGFFKGAFDSEVIKIDSVDEAANKEKVEKESEKKNDIKEVAKEEKEESPLNNVVFDTDSPDKKILPPDQDPKIAINKDSPGPAIAMISAYQNGDKETASKYAGQWIRYQKNYFFLVKEITNLIGQALIEQGEIDDDDWVGVGQYIDYNFVKVRQESGTLFKPKHEDSLKRVSADPKNEVEIYYFFSLNSSYSRKMAPEVERLWRATKNDKNVKMVALSLDSISKDWLSEYRDYSGWTLPVFEGEKVAKYFNVKFPPAIVIVTPNNKKAYLRTGQQSFKHMYEFMRTAQGLPLTYTAEIEQIEKTKIGKSEENVSFASEDYRKAKNLKVEGNYSLVNNKNTKSVSRLDKF